MIDIKTKPCPACAHELALPAEYLNAIKKTREAMEDFREVIIKDFIENDLKETLFALGKSHSILSQAEYKRDLSYNNEHISYKVEALLITFLKNNDLFNEFMKDEVKL